MIPLEPQRECLCQSAEHPLIGNCLFCGKIICAKEGQKPCSFCGIPLETVAEIIVEDSNVSKVDSSFYKAVEAKNRMLQFDRENATRSKVMDDQTTWYAEAQNVWSSSEQRNCASKKQMELDEKQRHRPKKKITVDFQQKLFIEEPSDVEFATSQELHAFQTAQQTPLFSTEEKTTSSHTPPASPFKNSSSTKIVVNPLLSHEARDIYHELCSSLQGERPLSPPAKGEPPIHQPSSSPSNSSFLTSPKNSNLQPKTNMSSFVKTESLRLALDENFFSPHKEANAKRDNSSISSLNKQEIGNFKFLEHSKELGIEKNQCISIDQPWATMIMEGFKVVEGRDWPTLHRGRLWIHAASSPLDDFMRLTVEALYESAALASRVDITQLVYPISSLLGFVTLETCLSYEEYTQSNYTIDASLFETTALFKFYFVLSHPLKLKNPVKMQGQAKLWTLENHLALSYLKDISENG